MEQQVTRKHITVKSGSLTNSTESVTNRLKLDKKRCHRPTRTTRLKKTYKTYSLSANPLVCNCRKLSNTLSQCKSCSPCNSRQKRYLSKRVTNLQKKEQSRLPYHSCFSTRKGISSPCSRQTVCCFESFGTQRKCKVFILLCALNKRTISGLTPLQMNTFLSLSIPKKTNRFTKTRKSTVQSKCKIMIIGMISSQNQYCKSYCQQPIIYTKNCSHKRQIQTNQGHTVPCFYSRSGHKIKSKIHLYDRQGLNLHHYINEKLLKLSRLPFRHDRSFLL